MKTVIVYDDETLTLSHYKVDNSIDTKNYDCIITNKKEKSIQYNVDYGLDLILLSKDRKIELDPTTMQKIYNHNQKINKDKEQVAIAKEMNKLTKIKKAIEFFEENIDSFSKSDYDTFDEYVSDKYDMYDWL